MMLTQDEVEIMQAKHILWQHDEPGGERADFSGCHLLGMDFQNMLFNGAIFQGAVFENANLTGAGMCSCDFSKARFIRCDASDLVAEEVELQIPYRFHTQIPQTDNL